MLAKYKTSSREEALGSNSSRRSLGNKIKPSLLDFIAPTSDHQPRLSFKVNLCAHTLFHGQISTNANEFNQTIL